MIILGIDPGYAIVGYGVVEHRNNRFTTVTYGAITTDAGVPFAERLGLVHSGMCELIERYRPDAVVVEQLFFTSNQKTAIMVAQARGVILLSAIQKSIPVFEYTPLQVKLAVVGYGRAVKQQVMEQVRRLLGLQEVPKPDDAADALALAICHAHTAGSSLSKSGLSDAVQRAEQRDKIRREQIAASRGKAGVEQ